MTGLEPTLASIQANIFTPICATSGCHSGATPMMGLNLEAGKSAANLIGVPSTEDATILRVAPGDSVNSFIIQKLRGTQTIGAQMPLDRGPLQDVTIDVIRQWIDDGALQ